MVVFENESALELETLRLRADEALRLGRPDEALPPLCSALTSHPEDRELYVAATNALIESVESGRKFEGRSAEVRDRCLRALILQPRRIGRPPVLAHALASRITSHDVSVLPRLAAEVEGVLRELLCADETNPSVVLLVLLLRTYTGSWLPSDRVTRLHFASFPHFDPEDLALPYNQLFAPRNAEENCRELRDYFRQNRQQVLEGDVPAPHVLTYEWVSGVRFFGDDGVEELIRFVKKRLDRGVSNTSEMGAMRALSLRYGERGRDGVDELLRITGVTELAEHRPSCAGNGSAMTLRRLSRPLSFFLETRQYKAVQSARNEVASRIPAIVRLRRRVKVAVCVSGQLRGFARALASWRRLFHAAECDFFVHTWKKIGGARPIPTRSDLPFDGREFCEEYRRVGLELGWGGLRENYPTLFGQLEQGDEVDEEFLGSMYGARRVVVDDERVAPFDDLPNPAKMYYKIRACFELASQSGDDYDLFVRIRPDLEIRYSGVNWRDMRAKCRDRCSLFCDHPLGLHYGHVVCGDQFAVGSRAAMEVYSSTHAAVPKLGDGDLFKFPRSYEGHSSLGYCLWLAGIDVRRAPVSLGRLMDAERLPVPEIRQAIEADARERMDRFDRRLLEALQRDEALRRPHRWPS